MNKDTMKIEGRDGRARVFDEEGTLISIDGVEVKKKPAREKKDEKAK